MVFDLAAWRLFDEPEVQVVEPEPQDVHVELEPIVVVDVEPEPVVHPKPKPKRKRKPKTAKVPARVAGAAAPACDVEIRGADLKKIYALHKGENDRSAANPFDAPIFFVPDPNGAFFRFDGLDMRVRGRLPKAHIGRPFRMERSVLEVLKARDVVRIAEENGAARTVEDNGFEGSVVDIDWLSGDEVPTGWHGSAWHSLGTAPWLGRVLQAIQPVAAPEKTHYALNEIMVNGPDGKVVATDGKRMTVIDLGVTSNEVFYVPARRALKVTWSFTKTEQVQLFQNDQRIRMSTDDAIVEVSRESVSFPPYAEVIPNVFTHTVTVNRHVLSAARRAFKQSPKKQFDLVHLYPDRMELWSGVNGSRQKGLTVKLGTKGSKTQPIGLNRSYLEFVLQWSVDRIGMSGPDTPVVFDGRDKYGLAFKHIISPIDLNP